jgi:hypothetical protein
MKYVSVEGAHDMVRKAICSAYFYNSAKIKGIGMKTQNRTPCPDCEAPALGRRVRKHADGYSVQPSPVIRLVRPGLHARLRSIPRADHDHKRIHVMRHRGGSRGTYMVNLYVAADGSCDN